MSVAAPERPSTLVGSQTPRVRSVPSSTVTSESAIEAFELAESVGLHLDPWQYSVLTDALGEDEHGNWSAFEAGLIVPRQNGKGAVLEARELAGLFLFDEPLIIHTAHEFKTCVEAFDRLSFWIENSDDLRKKVKKKSTSHGNEGFELRDGRRIRFLARTKGSGRGFTGDTIIFDEAYALDAKTISALVPTLATVPNPQIWYTSSAGFPDSTQLAAIRSRGESGDDPVLAFAEWSIDPKAKFDPDDRALWAQANPGLGLRITEQFIENEQRAFKTNPGDWARERLGYWNTEHAEAVVKMSVWIAQQDFDSTISGKLALGLDVAPGGVSSSISAAGRRPDRGLHVELVGGGHRPGTGWVVQRLIELKAKHGPIAVGLDPASEAGALIVDLVNAGIEVTTLTAREYAQACVSYVGKLGSAELWHLGQPEMMAALSGAQKRKLADAWAWDRLNATTDITPLVSSTIALRTFLAAESTSAPFNIF